MLPSYAVTQYEVAAVASSQAGDAGAACVFRRAARLSHASIRRWIRAQDGALQIVKNRFMDPAQRWGYESYSFFSQYNLLPVAWLANAYYAASDDDAIPECPAPADVGGVAFALPYATFRKVFAAAQGTYVEVMTGPDPEYDAAGLYRVHFRGGGAAWGGGGSNATTPTVDSLLGPSAAPPLNAALPLGAPSAIGGAWWTLPGDAPGAPRRTLANHTLQTLTAAVFTPGLTNSPASVAFTLQYVLWADGVLVTEAYTVAPGSVAVTSSVAAPGAAALFALLADAARGEGGCAPSATTGACTLTEPVASASAAAAAAGSSGAALVALLRARDEAGFTAALGGTPAAAAPLPFVSFGLQFPALVFDGTNNFTAAVGGADNGTLTVAGPPGAGLGSLAYTVTVPPGRTLEWAWGPQVPSRNGVIVPAYAGLATVSTPTPTLTYTITVAEPAVVAAGASA